MGIPAEQLMLVDSDGHPVDVDALIERLRGDSQRTLADDEVGMVVYVGDLGIYSLKPTESGDFLAQQVTEISRPRFSTRVLRKQIGATVLSVTADAVFVVREGNTLKKGIYLPEEKVAIPRWAERGSARRCWFLEQARSNPRPGQCPGLHRGVNPARI